VFVSSVIATLYGSFFKRVYPQQTIAMQEPFKLGVSPYGVSSKNGVCGDRPAITSKKLFQLPVAPDDLTQHHPNGGQDRRRVVECVNRFEKFFR